MGKRGPQPTPKELIAARGNRVRKERYATGDAAMVVSADNVKGLRKPVSPPTHLSKGAKKIWRQVSQFLNDNDLSKAIFNGVLEVYCSNYDRCQQLTKYFNTEGIGLTVYVQTKYDEVEQVRSQWKVYNDSVKMMNQAAQQLGLSPSSFSQIRKPVTEGPKQSGWEKIKNGAAG